MTARQRELRAARRALRFGLLLLAQVDAQQRRFTLTTESDLDIGQLEELLDQLEGEQK